MKWSRNSPKSLVKKNKSSSPKPNVKLRFGLGVSEVSNRWHRRRRFHVMANCCVEWFQIQIKSFPNFSMKITDEFISKFKFVSEQLVCDVTYSVCVLDQIQNSSIQPVGRNGKGNSEYK